VESYISIVLFLAAIWLFASAWRLRRRRVTIGSGAGAMMDRILDDQRRAAVEIIQEERAGARDPEDRDGDLPQLAGGTQNRASQRR
jgi:hypothetical protein